MSAVLGLGAKTSEAPPLFFASSFLADFVNDPGTVMVRAAGDARPLPRNFSDVVTFTRASTATFFNPAGVLATAAAGQPRFDYDPVTRQPRGLLIEGQRTNLLLRSSEFDNAVWSPAIGGTGVLPVITANAGQAPNGLMEADRIVMSLNGGSTISDISSIRQSTTLVSGTTYTYSVWLKSFDSNSYTLLFRDDFGSGNVSTLWVVTPEWKRFTVTAVATASSSNGLRLWLRGSLGTSSTADVLAWGAQLEAGSFASSYIPTTTAQVTRAADWGENSGANFSQWFNPNEGTCVFEVNFGKPAQSSGFYYPLAFTDGGNAETIEVRLSGGPMQTVVRDNGVAQAILSQGVGDMTAPIKVAISYKANEIRMSVNGQAPVSDLSATLPLLSRLSIGSILGKNSFFGHIGKLRYFPTGSTESQLQELTA